MCIHTKPKREPEVWFLIPCLDLRRRKRTKKKKKKVSLADRDKAMNRGGGISFALPCGVQCTPVSWSKCRSVSTPGTGSGSAERPWYLKGYGDLFHRPRSERASVRPYRRLVTIRLTSHEYISIYRKRRSFGQLSQVHANYFIPINYASQYFSRMQDSNWRKQKCLQINIFRLFIFYSLLSNWWILTSSLLRLSGD